RTTLFFWGLVFLAFPCLADQANEALKTELPEEVLAGTPPDVLAMLFPELALPAEELPPLMVPKGTANLALNKKVTSSDPNPILGELGYVTDGVKKGAEDAYVELMPGKQWVQIDLEQTANIHAVYLWHYFREARGYRAVIVQVSDDKEFKENVKTVYNNDTEAEAGMGIGRDRPYIETYRGLRIDAKGVKGRYVRLYSKGNTANSMNHYVEVEVYGKPAS
ncbi:MAG: discoidin domain-containing protein, partial [Planctomycetota bacterium]